MGGAISRSEAILRLHIPWVRIVIQVKALALATRAGWFGRWIFADDSRQHERCDHGHAPPATGSVGNRGHDTAPAQHAPASRGHQDKNGRASVRDRVVECVEVVWDGGTVKQNRRREY